MFPTRLSATPIQILPSTEMTDGRTTCHDAMTTRRRCLWKTTETMKTGEVRPHHFSLSHFKSLIPLSLPHTLSPGLSLHLSPPLPLPLSHTLCQNLPHAHDIDPTRTVDADDGTTRMTRRGQGQDDDGMVIHTSATLSFTPRSTSHSPDRTRRAPRCRAGQTFVCIRIRASAGLEYRIGWLLDSENKWPGLRLPSTIPPPRS